MYLDIDLNDGPARLVDPDNFKEFKVVVAGAGDPLEAARRAAEALGGREAQEHVFVGVDRLRELAGDRAEDPDWAESFRQMLAYASSKGWVDESGAVRAHVERR